MPGRDKIPESDRSNEETSGLPPSDKRDPLLEVGVVDPALGLAGAIQREDGRQLLADLNVHTITEIIDPPE